MPRPPKPNPTRHSDDSDEPLPWHPHPRSHDAERLLRDGLTRRRAMSKARRLMTSHPLGWRIAHRLTYLLMQEVSDRTDVMEMVAEAVNAGIEQAFELMETQRNPDAWTIQRVFLKGMLDPFLDVLSGQALMSLQSPRDPWLEPHEPLPLDDELVLALSRLQEQAPDHGW